MLVSENWAGVRVGQEWSRIQDKIASAFISNIMSIYKVKLYISSKIGNIYV